MHRLGAVALVLMVLAIPLALAQEHPAGHVGGKAPPPIDTGYSGGPLIVPLYCHIYDLQTAVPMNTQPMIDLDLARGFGLPKVSGVPQLDQTPNSLRFYGSPGLVEYNVTEDGLPRYHPERGISYDVLLDPAQAITGHWFMSVKAADAPQAGQTAGPEAGVMPAFTVRMTMRVGDKIGGDLDSGELIAEGETTVTPDKTVVNGAPIEFIIDLGTPLLERVPGDDSYNVKVEWFNAKTDDGAVTFTQRDWILHTGAQFPNRLEVGVLNPLALYSIKPTPVGNDLITIHAVLNSPFGNYDVDAQTLTIAVAGPTTPRSIGAPLVVQRNFEHLVHYAPVEVTWSWPFKDDSAQPGTYTVTVSAQNLQRTATVTKSATFVIPETGRAIGYTDSGEVVLASDVPEENESPAAGIVFVLVAATVAVALRRRSG